MNCRKLLLLATTMFMSASLAHAETSAKKKHKPLLERVAVEQTAPVSKKKSTKAKSAKAKASAGGSQRLKPNAAAGKPATGNLQREVVFDGSNVNGQYHQAGEAVAKVEQEKKMNDLIGMRRDYKDRMASEKERLQRGDAGGR